MLGQEGSDIARPTVGIDLKLLISVEYPAILAFTMRWLPFLNKKLMRIDGLTIMLADSHFTAGQNVEFFLVCPEKHEKYFNKIAKQIELEYPLVFYKNVSYLLRSKYLHVLTPDVTITEACPYFQYVAPSYDKIKTSKFKNIIAHQISKLLEKV